MQDIEKTIEAFNGIELHDAKLVSFELKQGGDGKDVVLLEIRRCDKSNRDQWIAMDLEFTQCRYVSVRLDVLGKRLVGGDISYAECKRDSDFKTEVLKENQDF